MINSGFPSLDHKLVTGDPFQILLGNVKVTAVAKEKEHHSE